MKRVPFSCTKYFYIPVLLLITSGILLSSCASRGAIQAEEYFSIGMAYYEMGKFQEAEKWLNQARAADKTMTASAYNLGRIAFETGRYEEAARHFESILVRDPENVMALRAASYSRIKNGDLEKAEALYIRVLALVPESADDGFNYALVLYGIKKYDEAENVLFRYPYALEENAPSALLLARTQKIQGKVEAVDSYAKWLTVNTGTANPQGLYEYAQVLENSGFYARAVEQYNDAISALTTDTAELKKSQIRFEQARLLLTVDPENEEGLQTFNKSVEEGFNDTEAIEALLDDERLSSSNRDEIRRILDRILYKETPYEETGYSAVTEQDELPEDDSGTADGEEQQF